MTIARVALVLCVACSGKTVHVDVQRLPDASPRPDASDFMCRSGAEHPLVCDTSTVNQVPFGPTVTVGRGSGTPPEPEGGSVLPGAYQLFSETMYGGAPPDDTTPRPGNGVRRTLYVDCDIAHEHDSLGFQLLDGNDCRQLVPRSLDLRAVSKIPPRSGMMPPDTSERVAYTAHGDHLVLIYLHPYWDFARNVVLGSYTTVDEFVHLGEDGSGLSLVPGAAAGPPAPGDRDPRCPASPFLAGTPCSPVPAPLECEYAGGGADFGPPACSIFAECAMAPDGSFHFVMDEPSLCASANPPYCPRTFAEASALDSDGPALGAVDGGTPQGNQIACNYAEGVCSCRRLGVDTSLASCGWECRAAQGPGSGLPAGCPWPQPLAGDPCPADLVCEYDGGCLAPYSLGPSMTCVNGHWAQYGNPCPVAGGK